MTISMETVRMAKSQPRKNQSECSDLPCHIIILFTDLRGKVFRCATESLGCCSVCDVFFTQTKVGDFNMTIRVEKKVFKLSQRKELNEKYTALEHTFS